jgi:predicted GNAT superfamily acetyltransferase
VSTSPTLQTAERDAGAAARRAGVLVRQARTMDDAHAVAALLARIWGVPAETPPLDPDLLRALAHLGGYVGMAHDGDTLVAAGVGLFGAPGERTLHSHIVGVAPEVQVRSIGSAVKLDQRAWALAAGVHTVTWTFDPLVRRNAYFNLAKLGARGVSYLVDFYGDMDDGLNAGQGSDRLLVAWDVRRPLPAAVPAADAPAGPPAGQVMLDADADGAPVEHGPGPWTAPVLAVQVPDDVVALRRQDPDLARAWRAAVRRTMGAAVAAGYGVRGMTRSGWYRLERPAE